MEAVQSSRQEASAPGFTTVIPDKSFNTAVIGCNSPECDK